MNDCELEQKINQAAKAGDLIRLEFLKSQRTPLSIATMEYVNLKSAGVSGDDLLDGAVSAYKDACRRSAIPESPLAVLRIAADLRDAGHRLSQRDLAMEREAFLQQRGAA